MSTLILIAAVSYLLGSIPFGYLLVRVFRGEDVRQSGSGNIGATNVSRTSPVLGVATLLLDALKGTAAVWIACLIVSTCTVMSMAAMFAVLGHMFPLWLKFRGGKGVATGLGAFSVLAPAAVLIAAAIFLFVVIVSRYVSLASILAVASFPVLIYKMRWYGHSRVALVFMIGTSLLIIFRHHENIGRLLAGTEPRIGAKRT